MKVLVYGLGRSGLAVSRLLLRQGHDVLFYDEKPQPEGIAALEALGATFCPPAEAEAEVCIAAPGVPWQHPDLIALRDRGLETIGEVEWVYRTIDAPIVGITGTAGKGTVTRWLTDVLQFAGVNAHAGGNIDPALSEVAEAGVTLVTELSSFMLERCPTLKPALAVLLNLGVDHLDRHGSLQAYHGAKKNLLKNLDSSSTVVYNAEDPILRKWMEDSPARKLGFSLISEAEATLEGNDLVLLGSRLLSVDALGVRGRHNYANALAVALSAHTLRLPRETIAEGLKAFRGVPGRYSLVGELSGVTFIEDSIATRTLAVRAALEATPVPVVWIGGGLDKGADFTPLEDLVREKVVLFIGIGQAGPKFAARLSGLTQTLVCTEENGKAALENACRQGFDFLRTRGLEGTILLSPLAASFDQFKDYGERARSFREAVAALKEGVAWT